MPVYAEPRLTCIRSVNGVDSLVVWSLQSCQIYPVSSIVDHCRRIFDPVDRLASQYAIAHCLGQTLRIIYVTTCLPDGHPAPFYHLYWVAGRLVPPPFQITASARVDAIVVLAGGVFEKGSLRPSHDVSDASRLRVTCGADLWVQRLAPKLLLTGGIANVLQTGPPESHEMKRWALRLGIPESAILVETQSRTTYENAIHSKAVLGGGHILLVTAAYHLPRAVGLFEKQGFDVTPVACGYESQHTPAQAWARSTSFDFIPSVKGLLITTQAVDEVAGMLIYRIAGKM